MRRAGPPFGSDFRKLSAASGISNIGDGVTMVAGPLLVASMTNDPRLVAGATFVQALPWLLFSVLSGVYVDRFDRRRTIVVVNVLRGLVLSALSLAVATHSASIPLVYVAFFLFATGETLADTAAASHLPSIVPTERLASANALLMGTFTIGNQFLAKPFGAFLFVVAAAAPFGFDALTFFAAAALVSTMRPMGVPDSPGKRRSVRAEAAEGLRWLWRHRLLRTLALSMGLANLVFVAAFAVFVLYARQRLGVAEVGYGFLLSTFAIGGLCGTLVASWMEKRFGAAIVLRLGLVIEVLTHLTLAVTTVPLVAGTALAVFGVHTMVWGVIVVTTRQRLVPDRLRGRVNSVYALFDATGAAAGALLGGVLAQLLGITGPYWVAFGTMIAIVAFSWRPIGQAARAVAAEPATPQT